MQHRDTKKTILTAAIAEFSTKTYDSTSLNTILANAKISKGSFYYFFKSKKDLYTQLLLISLNAKNTFLAEKTTAGRTETITNYMHSRLQAGLEFARLHPDHLKLASTYSTDTTSPISKEWLAANAGATDTGDFFQIISASRKRGEINKKYSDMFVMGVISALFSQFQNLYPTLGRNDEQAVSDAVGQCVDFIIQGLK